MSRFEKCSTAPLRVNVRAAGLVADDVLYLKADETLSPFFEERGLDPFHYQKRGKTYKLSYYMAPEEILTILWRRRAGPLDRMRRPFGQRSR
jgi:hypothetical protein